MASRTVSTGEEVDAALDFLGKQSTPPVSGQDYFMNKITDIMKSALKEADEKRFDMVKKLLDEKNKGESISKLRELLGAS